MDETEEQEYNINAEMMKLTPKQRVLIEALVNPENRCRSISTICKDIGIDRKTYYKVIDKEEFRNLYERLSKNLVKDSIGLIINTFVSKAQDGSFQHGKVILEMAGIYNEKQDISISGGLTFEGGLRKLMDDDAE